MLKIKRFSSSIDTIYKQIDEEMLWELYLSNPIKETSYKDWKEEVISRSTETNEEDIEAAKTNALNILKNFKPE